MCMMRCCHKWMLTALAGLPIQMGCTGRIPVLQKKVYFQGFATSYPRNDQAPDDYNMFTGRQIHCEGML